MAKHPNVKCEVNGKTYTIILVEDGTILTNREREALQAASMILENDFSTRKVGEVIGVSQKTVLRRIHQLLPKMSKSLYNKVAKKLSANYPESFKKG